MFFSCSRFHAMVFLVIVNAGGVHVPFDLLIVYKEIFHFQWFTPHPKSALARSRLSSQLGSGR